MTLTSTAPPPGSRSRPWIPATWHSWLSSSDLRDSSTTAVTVTCQWGWTSTTWPRCSSAPEMTILLPLRPMMVVILSLSCSKALVRAVDFAYFWCFCFVFVGDSVFVVFICLDFCCHSVWLLWKCGWICEVLGGWRWDFEFFLKFFLVVSVWWFCCNFVWLLRKCGRRQENVKNGCLFDRRRWNLECGFGFLFIILFGCCENVVKGKKMWKLVKLLVDEGGVLIFDFLYLCFIYLFFDVNLFDCLKKCED